MTITDKDLKPIRGGSALSYKIIDGKSCAFPDKMKIEINETLTDDVDIIVINSGAQGITIENSEIEIVYKGGHTMSTITFLYNEAKYVTLRNCRLSFRSESQVNFNGVKNFGGVDTHLETPADALDIKGCRFDIRVCPSEYPYANKVCGIINTLANSVVMSDNYIYVQVSGSGPEQIAYGVINSGRFARIENNNIKANGSHNKGRKTEAAHTCGVYNTGLYMLFHGNNCVGEWGGKCVGLYCDAELCSITGNKILSTHTICGRSVIIGGQKNILTSNIITSTSRNAHIVEIKASRNIVTNNFIHCLITAISGCGIFMEGQIGRPVAECIIKDNQITEVKDYGIAMLYTKSNHVSGNIIKPQRVKGIFIPIFHLGRDFIEGDASEPRRHGDFNVRDYEYSITSLPDE